MYQYHERQRQVPMRISAFPCKGVGQKEIDSPGKYFPQPKSIRRQ